MTDEEPTGVYRDGARRIGLPRDRPPPDFASFERLVERLGITPVGPEDEAQPWLVLGLPDRREYDVFGLVNAVFDRLEELAGAEGSGL